MCKKSQTDLDKMKKNKNSHIKKTHLKESISASLLSSGLSRNAEDWNEFLNAEVEHKKYGSGTIKNIQLRPESIKDGPLITIAFEGFSNKLFNQRSFSSPNFTYVHCKQGSETLLLANLGKIAYKNTESKKITEIERHRREPQIDANQRCEKPTENRYPAQNKTYLANAALNKKHPLSASRVKADAFVMPRLMPPPLTSDFSDWRDWRDWDDHPVFVPRGGDHLPINPSDYDAQNPPFRNQIANSNRATDATNGTPKSSDLNVCYDEYENFFSPDYYAGSQNYHSNMCTLKTSRSRPDINDIKKVVSEFEIKTLIHFTHIDNLESILQHGLIGRKELGREKLPFKFQDKRRYDGGEAICLSVSFPNWSLFYKFRKNESYNDDRFTGEWVILFFFFDILSSYNVSFTSRNAANSSQPKNLSQVGHFREMFKERPDKPTRATMGLPKHFTTDPQAEILCHEKIDRDAIESVCFEGDSEKIYAQKLFNKYPSIPFKTCPDYFDPRVDWTYWQQK